MTTTSPGQDASAGGRQMRRHVGFLGLLFVSLGSVIGSGWLLGALSAATYAGGSSVISWVLAGIIMAFLALVHAELGAAYPVSGGTARYPRLAFGGITSFTAGWFAWLQSVTLAPIEVEAALGYLSHITPASFQLVSDSGALTGWGLVISVILIAVFTVNKIMVMWKFAVPLLTVIVLMSVSFHGSNFNAGGGFLYGGAHGIFVALPLGGVVFALQGFEQAAQIGGEARNPQKDVPRAILGAMIIGVILYLLLELAFIGSLNPMDILRDWKNPVGKGDFGPYATLATSLGLGWLAVILYIDAFVSPAGTGLVYLGTSSRLSYALGHAGYVPKGVANLSKRGVPYTSIIISFVVGLICFLPFPSWQSLVGLVTSATVFMYAFAPITLAALRQRDPDRKRPYRIPFPRVVAPISFIAANLIIYWSGFTVVWKLELGVVAGFIIFAISYAAKKTDKPALNPKALIWIVPWLLGQVVIGFLGQYDGKAIIPDWWDLVVVAVFSLIIFYVAVNTALPTDEVKRLAEIEAEEAEAEDAVVTA
jgi:amino acid transporter